jgi:hypothetical protein
VELLQQRDDASDQDSAVHRLFFVAAGGGVSGREWGQWQGMGSAAGGGVSGRGWGQRQGVGSAAIGGSASAEGVRRECGGSAEGVGCRVTDRQTRHSSCLSKENFGICGKRRTGGSEKQRVTARASKRVWARVVQHSTSRLQPRAHLRYCEQEHGQRKPVERLRRNVNLVHGRSEAGSVCKARGSEWRRGPALCKWRGIGAGRHCNCTHRGRT